MSVFSRPEPDYLAGGQLGRPATISPDGLPHVVPPGGTCTPALDVIDAGGRDLARTKKSRNVRACPDAALVIDDVLPPWQPRAVMIGGHAQALENATGPDGQPPGPVIRIQPVQVISWGLDSSGT